MTRTANFRRMALDHFEPERDRDPQDQRRLRGHLEQIDYTAYAANVAALRPIVGDPDAARFQRLAVAVAQARGQWVSEALAMTETAGAMLSASQTQRLTALRTAHEELTEAYEALRRMVERGYVTYRPAP
jgi:acyl carrier protein phosphodiesterase